MEKEGFIHKVGDFLGIKKFGQGLATTVRTLTGEADEDIKRQQQSIQQSSKILYAARQETDPEKRRRLLELARDIGQSVPSASQIDPGLNLSNREIIGSAANVGLNVLTPGAFKGGVGSVLSKNAALGAGFGAASGAEKGRSASGIVGSAVGGAVVGTAIGAASIGTKVVKDFLTRTTPKWLMDKAVRPSLDELKKNIKYGNKSLGEELLNEGVKGGPKKLLEIADQKLTSLEDELQGVLNSPSLGDVRITRDQIAPFVKDLIESKAGTPGMKGDVQRIKNIVSDIPEQMTLLEANQMKRRIYNELRDPAYKLDAKLGTKAKTLKKIASGLKKTIEDSVGGTLVSDINKKLSIYGRLEDRIVDQMARSMRNNSFGLTDVILATGGIASLNPVGFLSALGAVGIKRAGGSTAFRTTAAQALNRGKNIGTGVAAQTIRGAAKRAGLNTP